MSSTETKTSIPAKIEMSESLQRVLTNYQITSDEYRAGVIYISQYALAVSETELPTLTYPGPNWKEFVEQFLKTKKSASDWMSHILVDLVSVPEVIEQQDNLMDDSLTYCLLLSESLLDPNIPDSQRDYMMRSLGLQLDIMDGSITLMQKRVNQLVSNLNYYHTDLLQQAEDLQKIADEAKHGADVNRQKIDELEAAIAELKRLIKSLTNELIGLGVATAATAGLMIVAFWAGGPAGWVAAPFLGIVAAIESVQIILDSIALVNAQRLVKSKSAQLTEREADVAQLNITSETFLALAEQAGTAREHLENIVSAWDDVQKELNATRAACDKAGKDLSEQSFRDLYQQIQTIQVAWNDTVRANDPLIINMEILNGELAVGMTPEEVNEVIESSNTLSLKAFVEQQRQASEEAIEA